MPTRVDRYRMYWDTVLQQIFTVIKTGKKYEKLFFWRKKTLFGIFGNSISENQPLFEILGNILKLYLAIIFGVRIFRVFEVLGKLPYIFNLNMKLCCVFQLELPHRMSTHNIPVSIYKRKSSKTIIYLQPWDFSKALKSIFETAKVKTEVLLYILAFHYNCLFK